MAEDRDGQQSFLEKYGTILTPVILTAVFSLAGVYISNSYQATTSATLLISEREKAESELRASMFKDLIGPIIGDPKHIPLDRERLLVELLALNFGEHFELKPLMLQIDKKLAAAEASATTRATREQLGQERRSLRSIARRVSSRQIAMLLNQGTVNDKTRIVPLAFIEWGGDQDLGLNNSQEQIKQRYLETKQVGTIGQGEVITLCSPDHKIAASVGIVKCNWNNQSCVIHVNMMENDCLPPQADPSSGPPSVTTTATARPAADLEFESGWYDFPLTDNTLLSDGNRFALVLQELEPDFKTVSVDFVWFPKVYFAPRERPINYADIRKKLKINPNR